MEAEVYVGSRALPTILNFSVNILEVINLLQHIILKKIMYVFHLIYSNTHILQSLSH